MSATLGSFLAGVIACAVGGFLVIYRARPLKAVRAAFGFALIAWLLGAWCVGFLWIISGKHACAGKIERGKYYLGDHGHYAEVSRERYERDLAWGQWSGGMTTASFASAFVIGMIHQRWWAKRGADPGID